MAHAVTRLPLSAELRVRSKAGPFGNFCAKSDTEARCFSEYFNFPLSISSHQCSTLAIAAIKQHAQTLESTFRLLVFISLHARPFALSRCCMRSKFEFERRCVDGLKCLLSQLQNQNNCFYWISASVTSLQFRHARNCVGCQRRRVVFNKLKVLCALRPL